MDILKTKTAPKRKRGVKKDLLTTGKKNSKRSKAVEKEKVGDVARIGYKVVQQDESSPLVLHLQQTNKLPMTLSGQEAIRGGEPLLSLGKTTTKSRWALKPEILSPDVNQGLRNEPKNVEKKFDQQYYEDMWSRTGFRKKKDLKVYGKHTSIEKLEVLGENLGKGDDTKDMDVIRKVLKFLLGVWAKELNAREDNVKWSVLGRKMSGVYTQTESFLNPLFHTLKKKELSAAVKKSITDIIKFMLQREYVKANDTYLQMVTGEGRSRRGITMVGINIYTCKLGRYKMPPPLVFENETQKRYCLSIKRLVTVCQNHFPKHPPKCAEHNSL